MKAKSLKLLAAIALAFGPLFFVLPAQANPIQFTYYWTAHEFTYTDVTVNVTVTNDITNKIGGNGEVIDTYRITLGNQVIEKTEKHGPRVYTFDIVGTQTLRLEGIDNGYWGGLYGPIMQVEVVAAPVVQPATESPTVSPDVSESPTVSPDISESPTVSPELTESPEAILWDYVVNEGGVLTAEAPSGQVFSSVVARYVAHDSDCGLDVSEIVGAALIGSSSGTIAADNGSFGDPCPGWYKKLVVSVQYSSAIIAHPTTSPLTESAIPTTSPEVTPTPQPTPEPSPEPLPQPEPLPTQEPPLVVEPEPIIPEEPEEEPVVEPQPEQSTISPEEEPTPEPEVTEVPTEEPAENEPEPLPEPEPSSAPEEPATGPVEETSNGIIEEVSTVEELAAEAEQDDPEVPEELAAIPLIGDVAGAVLEVFNDLGNVGADMTPEVREKSEKVVVASVIVGQIAQVASAAAASAASAATRKVR